MTLDEHIKNILCKSGIQEATGVEVTYADGTKLTIHSDDHPALAQTVRAGAAPTVRAVQSAQGGM